MFLLRNKTDISIFQMKKAPYLLLCAHALFPFLQDEAHHFQHLIFFSSSENRLSLVIICIKCQTLFSGIHKETNSKYHLLKFLPSILSVNI